MPKMRALAGAEAAGNDSASRHEELSRHVLRQFRLVFNSVRTHFREVEKSTGLGGAQVWALSHIREKPGLGVSQLAAALDIHQSTASNLVRGLVAKDMIRTEQGKHDRRSVRLLIRPAGRALLRKVPGPFTGVLPQALSALDAAALRRLKRDLAVLIATMAPDKSAARKPLAQM